MNALHHSADGELTTVHPSATTWQLGLVETPYEGTVALLTRGGSGAAVGAVDYETGEPFTQHTTNPGPFVLVNADPSWKLREGGKLCDIVPTLIEMMGMEKPAEMTGESLIVRG